MKATVSFIEASSVPSLPSLYSGCTPSSKTKRTKKTAITTFCTERVRINAEATNEIRVCVNRTCRRQGSLETLQIVSGIVPPGVSVKSCSCLGRCGAGPNLVVLPVGTFFSHCGTAVQAAQAIFRVCNGDDCGEADSKLWVSNSLAALALRKRAEDELGKDNAWEAECLLSQAINLKPCGGVHILYKDRSAARLTMGKLVEALEDAKESVTLAPRYPEAYLCQGDAFMAMMQFESAEKSYIMAVELDPPVQRSKSFKARIAKLQDKLSATNLI